MIKGLWLSFILGRMKSRLYKIKSEALLLSEEIKDLERRINKGAYRS